MSKGSVLIVEDESSVAAFTQVCLERMGYTVCGVAPTGEEALTRAGAERPDLVLMDIGLAGALGGIETAQKLRFGFNIPVIYLTGSADPATLAQTRETEAIGYVLKPFDLPTLQTTVETALHQFRLSQVRAANAIGQAHEKYRSIFEDATEGIFQSTVSGRIITANPACARMLGYESPEELYSHVQQAGRDVYVDPARRDEIVRLLESEGIARNFEARFRRRDGTEITALLNARAVRDSGGKTLYYEGMVTDITDLRRAERAVLEREALLTAVTSSARDAIILMDDEGRVSFWNPAAQRILGWSEQEVLGRSVHEIIAPPRYHDAYRQGFSRFLETGDGPAVGRTLELDALRHDGTEVPVELSLAAVQLKGKWHAIGVVRDISERRLAEKEREQMEVRLRHRQKLEGIGRLAAGIAHEINTPAQYIGDNVRFLKDSFAGLTAALAAHGRLVEAARDGNVTAGLVAEVESALEAADLEFLSAEIPQAIDQTLEGVERVSTIVRAMKEFSHPGSQEKLPTDIHKALESTLIVCRNEYKYVADVQTEFDRSLPLVPCWPCEFNQVMLNLIVNAAQAIQDILGPEPTERGRIRLSTARVDGWAEIRLADSGAGIPPEIRGRVFEPFFTTKEVGKGTGQGLAIAHAVIVGKHGGTIDLESEVGRGTTFIIRLPLEEHAAAAGSPPAVP